LELLSPKDIQTNPYIKHPVSLEQYLMEGSYNKVQEFFESETRAIAHAYATSPGHAWSAYFSFSLFGRQRLR
jgi:hypothetical protein